MDHDFNCIQRQRKEEFEQLYERGLQNYIGGDWIGSGTAFNLCLEMNKEDGPTQHFVKLMEKSKQCPPDDWNGAFDWDLKPIPPEIDYILNNESESDGQNGSKL